MMKANESLQARSRSNSMNQKRPEKSGSELYDSSPQKSMAGQNADLKDSLYVQRGITATADMLRSSAKASM